MGRDHNLVITKAKLRLNSTGKKQEGITRFEESKLREPVIRQQFQLELKNRFRISQTSDQKGDEEVSGRCKDRFLVEDDNHARRLRFCR